MTAWTDIEDTPDDEDLVLVQLEPWDQAMRYPPEEPLVLCAQYLERFNEKWEGNDFVLEKGAPDWRITHWKPRPKPLKIVDHDHEWEVGGTAYGDAYANCPHCGERLSRDEIEAVLNHYEQGGG